MVSPGRLVFYNVIFRSLYTEASLTEVWTECGWWILTELYARNRRGQEDKALSIMPVLDRLLTAPAVTEKKGSWTKIYLFQK